MDYLKKNINFTIENISRLISIEPYSPFLRKELSQEYLKYCEYNINSNSNDNNLKYKSKCAEYYRKYL